MDQEQVPSRRVVGETAKQTSKDDYMFLKDQLNANILSLYGIVNIFSQNIILIFNSLLSWWRDTKHYK